MRSKMTNKILGKTLVVMILDSYQEYVNLGYPKDPKIYVISAEKNTLIKISTALNKSIISKSHIDEDWGFQMNENNNLSPGEIIFGPEQVRIVWDGK